MRAGRLRHKIEIQQIDTGRDDAGGNLQTVTTVLSTRARADQSTGREYWASEHTATEYDVVFTIRYRTGITENMLVAYDGGRYKIKSIIDPSGYKRELKILAVRHV